MEIMGVKIGPTAIKFAEKANDVRIDRAEKSASEASKEHRIAARNARLLQNDLDEHEEGFVYGAGIAD